MENTKTKLADSIYKALQKVDGFHLIGMDEQGELVLSLVDWVLTFPEEVSVC